MSQMPQPGNRLVLLITDAESSPPRLFAIAWRPFQKAHLVDSLESSNALFSSSVYLSPESFAVWSNNSGVLVSVRYCVGLLSV